MPGALELVGRRSPAIPAPTMTTFLGPPSEKRFRSRSRPPYMISGIVCAMRICTSGNLTIILSELVDSIPSGNVSPFWRSDLGSRTGRCTDALLVLTKRGGG